MLLDAFALLGILTLPFLTAYGVRRFLTIKLVRVKDELAAVQPVRFPSRRDSDRGLHARAYSGPERRRTFHAA